MRRFFAIFFFCLLLLPLGISKANRLGFKPTDAVLERVEIESQLARYASRFGETAVATNNANQYLLFFYWNNRLYKTVSDHPLLDDARKGKEVSLPITIGRLGYSCGAARLRPLLRALFRFDPRDDDTACQ
ncbi:MAG: hypothetical protein R2795_02890 [Saprospiraceae bacterium]